MSLNNVPLKPYYGGFSDNLVEEFYKPCLENSILYKRSTAYFTGGVYALATSSFKKFFLDNDGYIELVTSPFLDAKVHDAFNDYQKLIEDELFLTQVLEDTFDQINSNQYGQDIIELISLLLGLNKLTIKIAVVPEPGIHHEKIGIFEDNFGNAVSFSGSINETWSGWYSNSEEFKVFNNWDLSSKYYERDLINFENLWNNKKLKNKTLSLPEAIKDDLIKIVSSQSKELLETKLEIINDNTHNLTLEQNVFIEEYTTNSSKKKLMKHQEDVLNSWNSKDKFGLVIHATGSGKTITGIKAIAEWLEDNPVALVVVPSIILLEQWVKELYAELDDVNVFITGGSVPKTAWIKSLKFISAPNTNEKFVIVSTLATSSSKDFIQTFKWGTHVLIVVDEVHRIGSNKSSSLMEKSLVGAALGLSATPERFGDENGTKKIFDYFKNKLDPKFTLDDAINVGRLVPYEYFPVVIELTEKEQEAYDEFTEKIINLYYILENDPNNISLQEQYKRLLILRSKILKQAELKPDLALKVLLKEFKDGEHWLVYCDETEQLNKVISTLSKNNIKTLKYTSGMSGDRSQTLSMFKHNGGVLVAIKCLDEGVDLPYLSNAIILASSQNPREHIQRRGRVLRKTEGKYFAKIYDAVVVPNVRASNLENDSIMIGELKRAISFAEGATNPKSKIDLIELAMKFNINLETIFPQALEEE